LFVAKHGNLTMFEENFWCMVDAWVHKIRFNFIDLHQLRLEESNLKLKQKQIQN